VAAGVAFILVNYTVQCSQVNCAVHFSVTEGRTLVTSVLHSRARSAAGAAGPKGEAIAAAALRLFLRDGYERTSVDAIAAEAGVSKRTVYNRYGDKESLFLSVLRETFAAMLATFGRIAAAHLTDVTDVEQDLTAFVREAALTLTAAPDRIALIRLILTEAPYFPALLRDEVGQQSMHATIARALSRLARRGSLSIADPAEAADHLFALTFGQVNNRSMFAAGRLSNAEVEQIVTSGTAVFLRAYRAA
jgi:TetR/AcrR family transcriptional regulator, mexJK operon transcriptional repressor